MLFARLKSDTLVLQVPLTKQHVKRAVLQDLIHFCALKNVTVLAAILEHDFLL